jgi:hypothetical protein
MSMHVCYLVCREDGLCHCLMIHIENLLQPLQLFSSICDLLTVSASYIIIDFFNKESHYGILVGEFLFGLYTTHQHS